jgi:hypothetical protein
LLRWSLAFLLQQALNCDLPDLYFLGSWDDRCASPCWAKEFKLSKAKSEIMLGLKAGNSVIHHHMTF